jgi:hypothetical protein
MNHKAISPQSSSSHVCVQGAVLRNSLRSSHYNLGETLLCSVRPVQSHGCTSERFHGPIRSRGARRELGLA